MPTSPTVLAALDRADAIVRAHRLPDPACAELDALAGLDDDGELCRELIPDDLAGEELGAELLDDEPPAGADALRQTFVQRLVAGEPALRVLAEAGRAGFDQHGLLTAALDALRPGAGR